MINTKLDYRFVLKRVKMNKALHPILTTILAICLAVLYCFHFSSQKIAYVNSSLLVNNYQGMIEARKAYQQKSDIWKANIDTLAREVQQFITTYEKDNDQMTSKEKELTQELIKSRQQQFMEYQKAINEKAIQEDTQMTSQVLEEVNAYIKKYGNKKGYKIIFGATEYGNIAYAEEGIDITDEVLEGLNKDYVGQ